MLLVFLVGQKFISRNDRRNSEDVGELPACVHSSFFIFS
jgi:hypothetical protein